MTPAALVRELDLENLVLLSGAHRPDGEFCVMEAVAYVAGEDWSDSPKCASPVIAAIMRRLNDTMTDEERQVLKPYIPRLVGTAATRAVEKKRGYLAADWCAHVAAPRAFRRIGLIEEAEKLEQLVEIIDRETAQAARVALRSAADAAYKFRSEHRAELEAKLRNLLVGKLPSAAEAAAEAEVAAEAAVEAAEAAVEAAVEAVAEAEAAEAAVEAAEAAVEAAEAAVEVEAAVVAADPAFLQRIADKIADKPYWDVYAIVRQELRERPIYSEALKQLRGVWIASALEVVDRMIALSPAVA